MAKHSIEYVVCLYDDSDDGDNDDDDDDDDERCEFWSHTAYARGTR